MVISVELLDEMTFAGRTESGQTLTLDASASAGGRGLGPSPTDALLIALGGCTGMDVISILRKMRQQVSAYRVELDGERASEHPRTYTSIRVVHVVTGRNLNPQMVARAVELSATRYCPISAMLDKAAAVKHSVRLVDEPHEAETSRDLPGP